MLGPKFFILYINDLVGVLGLVLFADGTTFFCSGEEIEWMLETLAEFVKIQTWFRFDTLSQNLDKTNYMIFSNRKKIIKVLFKIDSNKIYIVNKTKFCGVLID